MQENPSDHFSVSAVMLKLSSQHPWADDVWSLAGLVPGLSQDELVQIEEKGELHIWSDLQLQLYPLHCDSYYHNLISDQPKVYLVCGQNEDSSAPPQPLLLTLDYDEAASYMETDEAVFSTALSDELGIFLERFVLTHYQPEQPKKRRRQKWHNNEDKR